MVKNVAVIIPTYNEGDRLFSTLKQIDCHLYQSNLVDHFHFVLVVVDDCSTNPVKISDLAALKLKTDLCLLHHSVNLGQGASLQTGVAYCLDHSTTNVFLTMDADGQHDPKAIGPILEKMEQSGVDIVFCNRFATVVSKHMTLSRRLLLRGASLFERWITGLDLHDAHNGFRAFNRSFAAALDLKQNRMAHATEFKQIVASKGYRFCEMPVSIRYSAETLSKGQSNLHSLHILKDLLKSYLFNG